MLLNYNILRRDVLSLLLKEERVAESFMPWGGLFQIKGPKCENAKAMGFCRLKSAFVSPETTIHLP